MDSEVSEWVDDGDNVEPRYESSPGGDRGASLLPKLDPEALDFDVPEVVRAADMADVNGATPIDLKTIAVITVLRTSGTGVGGVVAASAARRGRTAIETPSNQGLDERPVAPDGQYKDYDPNGHLADPIDPITGEFVVRQVDLAFPSFGISFHHDRIYRSRIDYNGPHGHGWDHGYNQRLVAVEDPPPLDLPGEGPDPTDPPDNLPDSLPDPHASCGPVLALTTGSGTTLRFRELSRVGDAGTTFVAYESDASRLSLVGRIVNGAPSWTLTSQDGDVRHFDANGLLVRWVDANGVGLRLSWEAAAIHDWRLADIQDSAGREISYDYDSRDRLLSISEASSGLFASYTYGDLDELESAQRGDGRIELYEYDIQGRPRGNWIPEGCGSTATARSRMILAA